MGVRTTRSPLYGVDTHIFAAHFSADPRLGPAAARLLAATEQGSCRLVTSILTLLEVLLVSERHGDEALSRRYRALLHSLPNLTLSPIDEEVADLAAGLCAANGLRIPEAIQLATAVRAGATAFVTEDPRLRETSAIRVLSLDEVI